jgi:transposase
MAAAEVEASNGQAAVQRRRRVWSREEKRRIVAECLEPGASVSLVARRHDLNTNMLFTWRRQLGAGDAAPAQPVSFVPAAITAEGSAAPCPRGGSRIEIVLASGARVIVGTGVDESTLARVIKVLLRQR